MFFEKRGENRDTFHLFKMRAGRGAPFTGSLRTPYRNFLIQVSFVPDQPFFL